MGKRTCGGLAPMKYTWIPPFRYIMRDVALRVAGGLKQRW